MKGIVRLAVALVFLVGGLMVATPPAQAIVFDLTSDHCTNSCGPAGTIFGTVTLTQSGLSNGTGTVDVTVHLNSPFQFAKTGAVDDQAFKFNATGVVLGDITVNAHTPALAADTGAFNGDGTGNFAFGIICASCGGGSSSAFSNDIVFHVANATIADLTALNNLGNVFVVDIFNSASSGVGFGNTGPIDATVGHNVAEPASLFFFGSAMVLAGMLGRRWKRR